MSFLALLGAIYCVFIPVTFIVWVFFNWYKGDDLTPKELGSIMIVSIVPLVNILVVIIVLGDLFNVRKVADKVLIKGRNKNELG
jgi:NADH:ubiquinone oxidoreductase subunit 5 (subunit L)/multisubunit Na+/H+ antiporter MnhA subunit